MGLTRQAVQRVANDLAKEGLVAFAENPDHKRAKLVSTTDSGAAVLAEVQRRQIAWSNRLSRGLTPAAVEQAQAVLRELRERLDAERAGEDER